MQLERNAYNWYMWWKTTTRVCSFNCNTFKNDIIKRFQGITEKDFFSKITRLQQKRIIDEYTCEWEALATLVPELIDDQRLQTYIHGLKPHIQDELELPNTSTMEKARRKAKIIENKFKRSTESSFDKNYSKRNPPQSVNTRTSKYTPPHLMEGENPNLEA